MGWQSIEIKSKGRDDRDIFVRGVRIVSLNRRGELRFNSTAWHTMRDGGDGVVVMYDAERQAFGIRRTSLTANNAIMPRRVERRMAWRVPIGRILKKLGIEISATLTFREPRFDPVRKDLLILELDRAYVSRRTLNHWNLKHQIGETKL